jgi:hypothetical protein
VKIKNKIEKTGFFENITKSEESRQSAVKKEKRTKLMNIIFKKFF